MGGGKRSLFFKEAKKNKAKFWKGLLQLPVSYELETPQKVVKLVEDAFVVNGLGLKMNPQESDPFVKKGEEVVLAIALPERLSTEEQKK